jgi:cytochrome c551/c552
MANNVHNGSETPGRPPLRLLGFVVLLGALLAWWGTRDRRHLFGESPRKPVGETALCLPPNIQIGMVARGSQIERRQCAGCHDMFTRSSGPSYQEIVTFYEHHSSNPGGAPDLLSRLSSAIAHPQPGWGNFAPGPPEEGLSLDDRTAVASWMLSGLAQRSGLTQRTSAREGIGK